VKKPMTDQLKIYITIIKIRYADSAYNEKKASALRHHKMTE
jgi:hypothetical protein